MENLPAKIEKVEIELGLGDVLCLLVGLARMFEEQDEPAKKKEPIHMGKAEVVSESGDTKNNSRENGGSGQGLLGHSSIAGASVSGEEID